MIVDLHLRMGPQCRARSCSPWCSRRRKRMSGMLTKCSIVLPEPWSWSWWWLDFTSLGRGWGIGLKIGFRPLVVSHRFKKRASPSHQQKHLTTAVVIGIPDNPIHLTAFPVQEEEKDLPEDFLRLEVNFGEVFEKEQEDPALMDLLGKLCLKLSDSKLHSQFIIRLSFLSNSIERRPQTVQWESQGQKQEMTGCY